MQEMPNIVQSAHSYERSSERSWAFLIREGYSSFVRRLGCPAGQAQTSIVTNLG